VGTRGTISTKKQERAIHREERTLGSYERKRGKRLFNAQMLQKRWGGSGPEKGGSRGCVVLQVSWRSRERGMGEWGGTEPMAGHGQNKTAREVQCR